MYVPSIQSINQSSIYQYIKQVINLLINILKWYIFDIIFQYIGATISTSELHINITYRDDDLDDLKQQPTYLAPKNRKKKKNPQQQATFTG